MSEKERRVMSLMGHKQTFAVQKGMSALPPKANIQTADHESERLVVEPPL